MKYETVCISTNEPLNFNNMKKFYRIFAISFWLLCLILVLVLIGLLFTKFFWIGAISLMSISIFLAINADRNAKHEDYYEEN